MKMKKKVDAVVDFNCDDVLEWMETTDETLSFPQVLALYNYTCKLFEKVTRDSSVLRLYANWLDLKSSEKKLFIEWIGKGAV